LTVIEKLTRALERFREARVVDRLEHVVDRADVERLHGVLRMRGEENDVRSIFGHREHGIEAAHARHVDVEQRDVDVVVAQARKNLFTALAFDRGLDARHLAEQAKHALSRHELVVANDYA
jgi:hypothetical protein